MYKLRFVAASSAVVMLLAGCGGDSFKGTGSSTGGGNGGTGGTTTTYSLGNGTGSSFTGGALALSSTTLAAGGTATITATVVDQTGALYSGGAITVQFVSACLGSGGAKITASGTSTAGSAANSVTSATGTINATYTATGCAAQDTITASTTVGSQNLTATGTLTVQAGTIGSIQFQTATPANIGLKGTGLSETSTVVFLVVDSTGAPRPGANVKFTLPTNVGGVTLAPATATTGADGLAQTVVSSGTQHTSVRVTASIDTPALSTQSSVLTVTTGLPASDSFSMSVGPAVYGSTDLVTTPVPACPNVEAASINQVRVPVTLSLSDRYNTPAPDGTAITLNTNGGKIVGSCTLGGKDSTGATQPPGECTVQWSSEDPRPRTTDTPPAQINNKAVLFAYAIGEESFTDANGNGFYEQGEAFKDLGEPYRDDNLNGSYEVNEYFLDFNKNQVRDPATGVFKGITCTGNDANATCASNPLEISKSGVIVMSTSAAKVTAGTAVTNATISGAGFSVAAGLPFAFTVRVEDQSGTSTTPGNPIAAGSSVAMSSTGASMTGVGSLVKEGCSTNVGGDEFSVSGTAGVANSTGNLVVTVVSEATKTTTVATIPVTAN